MRYDPVQLHALAKALETLPMDQFLHEPATPASIARMEAHATQFLRAEWIRRFNADPQGELVMRCTSTPDDLRNGLLAFTPPRWLRRAIDDLMPF